MIVARGAREVQIQGNYVSGTSLYLRHAAYCTVKRLKKVGVKALVCVGEEGNIYLLACRTGYRSLKCGILFGPRQIDPDRVESVSSGARTWVK